jgi:hypothetical protein
MPTPSNIGDRDAQANNRFQGLPDFPYTQWHSVCVRDYLAAFPLRCQTNPAPGGVSGIWPPRYSAICHPKFRGGGVAARRLGWRTLRSSSALWFSYFDGVHFAESHAQKDLKFVKRPYLGDGSSEPHGLLTARAWRVVIHDLQTQPKRGRFLSALPELHNEWLPTVTKAPYLEKRSGLVVTCE